MFIINMYFMSLSPSHFRASRRLPAATARGSQFEIPDCGTQEIAHRRTQSTRCSRLLETSTEPRICRSMLRKRHETSLSVGLSLQLLQRVFRKEPSGPGTSLRSGKGKPCCRESESGRAAASQTLKSPHSRFSIVHGWFSPAEPQACSPSRGNPSLLLKSVLRRSRICKTPLPDGNRHRTKCRVSGS